MKNFKILMLRVKTLSPIRVGAKRSAMSVSDAPIVKVGGKCVIPGSTVKGALRNKMEEYLIDTYSRELGMKPCIPVSSKILSKEERHLIKMKKYRDDGACEYPTSRAICPVCYFLGANSLIGFVTLPFLYTSSSVEMLYSVGIDRATGTIAKGTNRDYEVLPQDTTFEGGIEILLEDTVKEWKLGQKRLGLQKEVDLWLENKSIVFNKKFKDLTPEEITKEFIIDRLVDIKMLGGFRSKGIGKVEVGITN